MVNKKKKVKGFKGFNKGLICRNFQYTVGKTYKTKDEISLCGNGFHFCENPFDVLHYYPYKFEETEFCKVEGSGELESDNNKTCASEITIKGKLKFTDLIELGIEYTNKKVNDILENSKNTTTETVANREDSTAVANSRRSTAVANSFRSTAVANGFSSTAVANREDSTAVANREDSTAVANSCRSTAVATGYNSTAVANSKNSIACGFGKDNKCKGKTGAWLVLCEIDENNNILNIQSVKVDGKKIKANTYYKLINNEIVMEAVLCKN